MKSCRKILSLMLTVLMIFSALSVCASAKTGTVEWDEYGENITVYNKVEDAQVGENTFSHIGYSAHRFTAEKEGLYAISMSVTEKEESEGYSYSCMVSKTSSETTATDFAEFNYSEDYGEVYYFGEGESRYLGVCTEGDIESYTLNITYFGKATDISLKDADRPLQGNYDVFLSDGLMVFMRGVIFHTDLGNDVCISDICVPTELTSIEAGELSAEITALGITQTVTFSVFLAEDEIKAVAPAEGFEAPTAYFDTDGEFTGYGIEAPSFLINVILKDGTVIENEYADFGEVRVTLGDGREIALSPMVMTEGEKAVYYLGTGDTPLFKVSDAKTAVEGEDEPDEPIRPSLCGILKMLFERFTGLLRFLFALLPPHINF